MPKLPVGDHLNYAGIDPGFTGAVGRINAAGTRVEAFDLPLITKTKDRQREFDLDGLHDLFMRLRLLPDCVVGIEWPSTRPGEGAERSERFGRGKGYLHAIAHVLRIDYYLIVPTLWKGRLGLDGKQVAGANTRAAALFDTFYPEFKQLIRGPRGGIKTGRLDALLIAHFLRTRGATGMRTISDKFGRNSDEALAFLLGQGTKKTKRRRKSGPI